MRTPILGGDKHTKTVETAAGSEVVSDGHGASAVVTPAANAAADASEAYERGRADALRADAAAVARERDRVGAERAVVQPRRRGSPLLTLLVVLLALFGAACLYLWIRNGSAQQGGAVVDDKLTAVTAPARQAVDNVRNTTGQAVENAGAALKTSGERIRKP